MTLDLEVAQQAMQERSKIARSKQASRNAGSKKKKRTRVTLKSLIIDLIQDRKVVGQVRLEALKLLAALGGKLHEEKHEEPKPDTPVPRGSDLGTVFPRT